MEDEGFLEAIRHRDDCLAAVSLAEDEMDARAWWILAKARNRLARERRDERGLGPARVCSL